MTDNPHPVAGRPWTAEEDRIAAEMKAAGCTPKVVGEHLGRSSSAVKVRAQYLRCSSEIKKRRLEARRDRTRAKLSGDNAWKIREEVPAHVIEDRNRRLALPRSLTATLMGDPVVPANSNQGRSA